VSPIIKVPGHFILGSAATDGKALATVRAKAKDQIATVRASCILPRNIIIILLARAAT
jgi:hypothetical protein